MRWEHTDIDVCLYKVKEYFMVNVNLLFDILW